MSADGRLDLRRLSGSKAAKGNAPLWDGARWKPGLPSLAALGAPKSTASPAFPALIGARVGDLHFNETTRQEYVADGSSGTIIGETFDGKTGPLGGQATTSGGGTWSALGTVALTCNGTNASSSTSGNDEYGGVTLGAAGAQEGTVDYVSTTTGRDIGLGLRGTSTATDGYWAVVHRSISTSTLFLRKGDYILGTTLASVAGPAASGTLRMHVSASTTSPVIDVYVNDVLLLTFTDTSSVPNGTYGKIVSSAPGNTLDNFSAVSLGTLEWAPTGPGVVTVASKTAAYTMAVTDDVVLANGTFTVTLPPAAGNLRRRVVKNIGTGTVTVAPAAGLIDGAASKALTVQYDKVEVVSNGTDWFSV